jgi:hypothetical protein
MNIIKPTYHEIDEQDLQALYCPEYYEKGEEVCQEILEHYESQPALLFLILNLAAQDAGVEALALVSRLDDKHLFRALSILPFGQGTEAESAVYRELLSCAGQRGMCPQVNVFLDSGVCPYGEFEQPHLNQFDNLIGV